MKALRARAAFAMFVFALLTASSACRWERDASPSFRKPESPDSLAILAEEIDPGMGVRLRAGHGFVSISDPWIELSYESAVTPMLLLSGELPEATREGPFGRAIRLAATSTAPVVLEVRLLDDAGRARSSLFAIPGGDAEVVAIVAPEAWLPLRTRAASAASASEWKAARFEILDVPGPARESSAMRVRIAIPASIDEGMAEGFNPFLAALADRLEFEGPMFARFESAWRGAGAGAAIARENESLSRETIRETAKERGGRGRALFDTSFAIGPASSTTMAAAAFVAVLESPERLPSAAQLAETYAARVVPEFLSPSIERALANVRAGTPLPRSGLALLDPGPAWDEDTDARSRAFVWGLLFPGDPYRAAAAATRDASITHSGAGVECARYAAALVAAALSAERPDIDGLLDLAESFLSRGSDAESVVLGTRDAWRRTRSTDSTAAWIERTWLPRAEERHPTMPWAQALPNLGMTALAMEAGSGDFDRTIRLAASFGLDADANAALCGATLGARDGGAAIPDEVQGAVGDAFRCAVIGAENWRLSRLAAATLAASRVLQFDPARDTR